MSGTGIPAGGAPDFLRLGERYAALGLTAAATSCLERAAEVDSTATIALRRLVELALASGRGREARHYAQALGKHDRSLSSRLLAGQAQLAAGELGGARFSFAAVVDAIRATPLERARAMLGRAKVAEAEGDRAGAAANIMGAAEVLIEWALAPTRASHELDREQALVDEVLRLAVAWDRGADIGERLDAAEASVEGRRSPTALLRGLWLAARQSHGDREVSDRDIESALAMELEARPGSRAVRLKRCERLLRRRFRDQSSRDIAIAELGALAAELEDEADANIELARVYFLLASAYEDDPATRDRAEAAYQRGLALRPSVSTAATHLAEMTLARGDYAAALTAVERALRIDGHHAGAWQSAVRLTGAARPLGREAAARVLDAAQPGSGLAAGPVLRLINAATAVARDEVLAGMFARGHRLKNLLGIIGVRARSARKLASGGELEDKLGDLETALGALYDEWGQYLRSMQTDTVIETVAVAPLVREVVQAARDMGDVPVELEIGATPDLTGDRVLLREALTNIVVNAVQACTGGGTVKVSARPRMTGSAPAVEIRVVDSGTGIPAAELGRVFSPGFTTKDLGSGIGLAVAERVISAHQGRIHIDSEEGGGTTVTVILPCELAALSAFATF